MTFHAHPGRHEIRALSLVGASPPSATIAGGAPLSSSAPPANPSSPDLALFFGAMIEVGGLDRECARLRRLLAANGIDPEEGL